MTEVKTIQFKLILTGEILNQTELDHIKLKIARELEEYTDFSIEDQFEEFSCEVFYD